MKKGFWIAIASLMVANTLFAGIPTMNLVSQPAGSVSSLPASFGVQNVAPIPQDLCSPTLTSGGQQATCSGLPVCRDSTAKTASFSCSVTTTCDTTVPASQNGGTCTIALNVTKPSTLPASTAFSFNISYGSYSALLASNAFTLNGTNPPPPADTYRTITFKNSCSYPVWFGSITGAAPTQNVLTGGSIDCTGANPGKLACVAAGGACYSRTTGPDVCLSQACSSDNDCVSGSSCFSGTNTCFWNNPVPSNGSFELANGATNTIEIPEYTSNNIGIVWSGAFGGRTGCTTGSCTSALCTTGTENAQGVCSLGAGFQQPATQVEPTFITYPTDGGSVLAPDAYDVTTINGANIPMTMFAGTPASPELPSSGNPFTCGAPGYNLAVAAGATIGPSVWDVATNQSNVAFRYVVPATASPTRCGADSDCTGAASGSTCGLTYSAQSIGSTAAQGSGQLVCGAFAGWFTADQICGTNNNFTNAINQSNAVVKNFACTSPLTSPTGTLANLYQCNGNYANSCYSTGAASSCCGCVNWGNDTGDGLPLPVPSTSSGYVSACVNANTAWTGSFSNATQPQVFDTVYFLKKSCPSCYVYPFDDASSSFACTNGATGTPGTNNSKTYTVEFCPGGGANFAP